MNSATFEIETVPANAAERVRAMGYDQVVPMAGKRMRRSTTLITA